MLCGSRVLALHHKHHYHPSQTTCGDRLLLTRLHAVSVVPTFGDLAAPSSFQRLIDHDFDGASSTNKGVDEQLEQQT
jgi:hypothetical protein